MQNNYHFPKANYSPMKHWHDNIDYNSLNDINFSTVAHINVSGRVMKRPRAIQEIKVDKEENRIDKEINYKQLDEMFFKLKSSASSLKKMRIENSKNDGNQHYNILPIKNNGIGQFNYVNNNNNNSGGDMNINMNRNEDKNMRLFDDVQPPKFFVFKSSTGSNDIMQPHTEDTPQCLNNGNGNNVCNGDNNSNTIRIPMEIINAMNININMNTSVPRISNEPSNILLNNPTQSSSKGERNPNRESRKCLKRIKKLLIKLNSKYQTINEKNSKSYLFAFDNNFYSIIFKKHEKKIISFTKNKLYSEEVIIKEENEIFKELYTLTKTINTSYLRQKTMRSESKFKC